MLNFKGEKKTEASVFKKFQAVREDEAGILGGSELRLCGVSSKMSKWKAFHHSFHLTS